MLSSRLIRRCNYGLNILVICAVCALLPCCQIYKYDIQQGNHITQELVNNLKPGLTKSEVQNILGTPALVPVLDLQQWQYSYYFTPGVKGDAEVKYLTLYFDKHDKLQSYTGDWKVSKLPLKKLEN